jgi:hypothetical protein
MWLLNRKQLDQMTDEELEKIYNDIRKELEEKKAKNRRIRGILSRKIKEKEESLNNLKNQINEVLVNHPELKKRIIYEKNMIKQYFEDINAFQFVFPKLFWRTSFNDLLNFFQRTPF